jgi:hypothetical protein
MRSEVLKAVKISRVVFWVVTPWTCGLVGGYQRFGARREALCSLKLWYPSACPHVHGVTTLRPLTDVRVDLPPLKPRFSFSFSPVNQFPFIKSISTLVFAASSQDRRHFPIMADFFKTVFRRTSQPNAWNSCILFGMSWVQIPARRPVFLTEVLRDFPQSLESNAGIDSYSRPRPLPFIYFLLIVR